MIGASEIADAVRCNQLSNRRSSPGTGGGHLPFVEPNRFKNICMAIISFQTSLHISSSSTLNVNPLVMRRTYSRKSLCALFILGSLGAYVSAEYVDPAILDACSGYNATNVQVLSNGLTADLVLSGKPCNIFGNDIQKLALSVVYETGRLTVFI